MHNIEKIRWILLVLLFIIIIVYLVIPAVQESNRRKKVSTQDIENYIHNTEVICLNVNNCRILRSRKHQSYNDATLLNRYTKSKNTLLLKNDRDGRYYLIESYNSSLWIFKEEFKDKLYLVINKEEAVNQGTEDNPIIALRYYIDEECPNVFIDNEDYDENVQEYLIYKNFAPSSLMQIGIRALITLIIILGIIICTILMKKRGLL